MAFFRLKLLRILCGILIICSLQQQSDAEIAVHHGDLRPVNCSTAILSMSGDSVHKAIWWQFLPLLQEYLEAFRVYMVLPQRTPANQCNIEEQLQDLGGLLSTRNASIAEDISVTNVKSLGSMTISMWMLGFLCPEGTEDPCKKLTPVVLWKNQEFNGSTYLGYSYELVSVWEVNTTATATNTAAARILDLPNKNLDDRGDHAITFRSVQGDQPLCGNRRREPRPIPEVVVVGKCGENKPVPELKPLCIVPEKSDKLEQLIESFMFQVKSSYIQAQTSAVNLDQGPPAEFWVAAIAFPSAFIAIVTTALPITNYLLKLVRKKVLSQRMKILLVCAANMLVSIISYGAVMTVVPAELKRQKSYETWGLLADEIPVSPRGLQVLVVILGKSDYRSSNLILVSVTFIFLIPLMVWISFNRCNQVVYRQKLLRKLRELSPEEPGDETIDDLRAIDMTSSEQELLEKTLQNLGNATKNSPSYVKKSPRSLKRMSTHPRQPYTNVGGVEVRLKVDGEGPR